MTPGVSPDVRICFFGDSFTAGVGDQNALGWVGRVLARSLADGFDVTGYNLGVRRDTGRDVARRWEAEAGPRLREGDVHGLVLAVGVNDTALVGGRRRASEAQTLACVRSVVAKGAEQQWSTHVIGPTPIADERHNADIFQLSQALAASCEISGTPYVDLATTLLGDQQWLDDVAHNDGAHPSAIGYARMAELIYPAFAQWLSALSSEDPGIAAPE